MKKVGFFSLSLNLCICAACSGAYGIFIIVQHIHNICIDFFFPISFNIVIHLNITLKHLFWFYDFFVFRRESYALMTLCRRSHQNISAFPMWIVNGSGIIIICTFFCFFFLVRMNRMKQKNYVRNFLALKFESFWIFSVAFVIFYYWRCSAAAMRTLVIVLFISFSFDFRLFHEY